MRSDNKTILKNSGILYVRLLIISVTGLFTVRYVLLGLGISDFGLYNVVGGIVILLNVLNTAMISTSFRFIAFEMGRGDLTGVNKVFNISLIIHIFLALFVVLFAETVGKYYLYNYLNVGDLKIGDAIFVFRFSILTAIFSILSVPFQAVITAQEKFSTNSSIEILSCFLRLGAAIIITYYIGNRLRLYAVLMASIGLISSLLYYLYCIKRYFSTIRWNFQRDRAKYKEVIGFTGWVVLGASAAVGKIQGAALIINSFFGTVLNASFGIANQLNTVVLMFSRNLSQAAIPQITKSYSGGNQDRTIQLVSYISKYSFFLLLLPSLPILLETNFILKLWLGKVPILTTVFCQLMIVNALIDGIGSGIPSAIQATGKIKYFQIILSALSLLSLPAAYFALRIGYPPYSILIIYILTSLISVLVMLLLLKKLIEFDITYLVRISYLKIFYVIICLTPLFFIRNLYHEGTTRFFVLTIISVFWFIIAVYQVGLEKKERALVAISIKNMYSKIIDFKFKK